jgi:hypothetical protein
MSSPIFKMSSSQDDLESGYASGSSETGGFPDVYFTKPHLKFLNKQLSQMEPEGVCAIIFLWIDHVLIINRHPEVVLNIIAEPLPDDSIWPHWPCYHRHAI